MDKKIVHKVTGRATGAGPLEFVLSDATKDRYGDVIDPKGWVLSNFKKNPIALFNHNSQFPIGTWENVRVESGKLVGKLKLAAQGTSDRIDEIVRLVEQGILRAVSVGFQPLQKESMPDDSGTHFIKQELLETSLVSVPANPSAVQLAVQRARSLQVSDDTISFVFGEQATKDRAVGRGFNGEQAKSNSNRKSSTMELSIAERIELAQERLVALKDQMDGHLKNINDDEPDEAALAVVEDVKKKIATHEKHLNLLKETEGTVATRSEPVQVVRDVTETKTGITSNPRRPFAAPKKEIKPFDILIRAALVAGVSRVRQKTPGEVIREEYGDDPLVRGAFEVVNRAASAPALTTTTGWAAELVQTAFLDMIETLIPLSVYPGLSSRGGRFTFGRNGIVSIPARTTSTTVAGSFVGQGNPIPVRQGAFTATTLTPKKMAVITTFTREMAEHSTPQIEQVLRQAIVEDTSVAIDSVLLDATAASAVRPAGLKNGVTGLTATTGGGLAALVGDVKQLAGALITSTNGHLREPVWIMNPNQALSIQFMTNAQGEFIFQNEINQGNFRGYPLLTSTTVPAGTVFLVDAADFFSATGDAPTFVASDQATLHMEDTTPLAIGTAGAPNTVAAPVRSLFQTDSIGIRMTMDLNWAMRRTGTTAWTSSVTW